MSGNPIEALCRTAQECHRHCARACQDLQQQWSKAIQPIAKRMQVTARKVAGPSTLPYHLAAISSAVPWKPVPVCDIALNSENIRVRLAAIPVYTVANSKNEFVLVSDEKGDSDSSSQLGLFFMNKADAQALIERIGQQDASMAKDTRVQTVTMDMVIDVFNRPEEESLPGVSFRFMPDQRQVQYAMELYAKEGATINQLSGIPVFQAEGLTINADNAKFVPIFFAKEDLDTALGTAHTKRNSTQAQQYSQKADALMLEYEDAQKQYAESNDRKTKRRAKDRADQALAQAETAREKARKVEAAVLPKVEVGCFENVVSQMERDTDGEWEDVMFIPPGSLSSASKP